MARATNTATADVPPRYPTSTIFIDESGAKLTSGRCFVVAAIKLRQPGVVARAVKQVRDSYDFDHTREFKFSRIGQGNVHVYHSLVDVLADSDAHIAACVVDSAVFDPFRKKRAHWLTHAEIVTQLLVGCINRRELVGVVLDGISTPVGCSLEDEVRKKVNGRFRATSVVSAISADSRTSDLLQLADLVAGAILHERRAGGRGASRPTGPKARISKYLGSRFDRLGLHDGRDGRVNIATYRGRGNT